MTGESGKNLEYTIYKRFREIDELKIGQKDNDDQIAIIYDMVRKSYNKFGLYRYDAFNPQNTFNGGSISFALTMLNSSDNGFILNVIHNRAGCHVYIKEIINGECEAVLAKEEQISLNMAMNKQSQDIYQEDEKTNDNTVNDKEQ